MRASLDFALPATRRTWIQRLLAPMDEAAWDESARMLFAWQFAHVPAVRRLCLAYAVTPQNLRTWREIPAMPQQAFKREQLYGAGLPRPKVVYETSGTTTGQPGRQHLLDANIYRAVSIEGARRIGLFDQVGCLHFLVPSPKDAPRSSLSAMFGFWRAEVGATRGTFWLRAGSIDFAAFRKDLTSQMSAGIPVGVAGTAFSFVHLLDAWADLPPLRLPHGSWLLETGGFKGRSREVAKPDLYAGLSRTFGVPDAAIHNEYGMSELSSQAYARGPEGVHETPPWARVLVIDPATRREVRVGQWGLVRWYDLADTDSVFALQTLDLAERTSGGFRLIGRMARTEPRGCSLGAEDLLSRHAATP